MASLQQVRQMNGIFNITNMKKILKKSFNVLALIAVPMIGAVPESFLAGAAWEIFWMGIIYLWIKCNPEAGNNINI